MNIFQILFALFVVFALFKAVGRYLAKEITGSWLIFWSIFWLVAVAVDLSPKLSDTMAHSLGIGRGADLVIFSAVALLFFFVFRLVAQSQRHSQEVTKLTRKISLLEAEKEQKK